MPEVLLWSLSSQFHCTVSPGWIVTDEGEKERSPPGPTVTMTVVAAVAVVARMTAAMSQSGRFNREEVFMEN